MPKTALVTGAGSGIGRGLALALAKRGYQLLLVGRDQSRLEATAHEIGVFSSASIFCADLADPSSRSDLIERVLAQNGAPSLLVNNAASMPCGDFLWRSSLEIETAFATNLAAPAELTQRFCSAAMPTEGLIFILSTAARFPQPYNSLYSASKAGLRSLAEALQVEFDGRVRVCLAYPPLTRTALTEPFGASSWPIHKADALQVAEQIISAYETGRNEISWFDWEVLPSFFYRFAPGLFRRLLKNQGRKLREIFNRDQTR